MSVGGRGGEGEEVVEASGGGEGSGGEGKMRERGCFLVPELKVLTSCWP